jgi:hypothetical protein
MKRYILTLTPEDGDGTTATAHIDINGAGPQVKQITFTAAPGGYLPPMPFDIEGFIAAVMPGAAPPITAPPRPAAHVVDSAAVPVVTDEREATAVVTAEPVARRGPGRARSAAAGKKSGAKTVAPVARSAKSPAVKKGSAVTNAVSGATPETAADTKKERVYNKMPDDFVTSFGKTTMADLATVYHVPLHTVQAWVRTARKQGLIAAAAPRGQR